MIIVLFIVFIFATQALRRSMGPISSLFGGLMASLMVYMVVAGVVSLLGGRSIIPLNIVEPLTKIDLSFLLRYF